MLKIISIFVAIIYLAVNTTSLVVSTVAANDGFEHTAVEISILCDSDLSSGVPERNCGRDQQNMPGDDSEHCFGSHFNFTNLAFIDYRPACNLKQAINSDVRIDSGHPSLIKKPPRIFS